MVKINKNTYFGWTLLINSGCLFKTRGAFCGMLKPPTAESKHGDSDGINMTSYAN